MESGFSESLLCMIRIAATQNTSSLIREFETDMEFLKIYQSIYQQARYKEDMGINHVGVMCWPHENKGVKFLISPSCLCQNVSLLC